MRKYTYSRKLHDGTSKVKDRIMAAIRMVAVRNERNKQVWDLRYRNDKIMVTIRTWQVKKKRVKKDSKVSGKSIDKEHQRQW